MKGHIRPRGKGTYAIVLDLGKDADGKRRQKWVTVKGTKKDAERELARLLHEINTGSFVEPSKTTLREYLLRWLSDYAKIKVSAKTFERYEEIIRNHLVPSIGNHILAKLQPLHIQAYYSQALQNGRRNGKGGLSAQTVLHHHRVLREALQQALKWQLLVRNPADAVEPPRPDRKEMKALDEGQTATLLDAAKGTLLYFPILLAVTTGMRRGEVLALRWSDVDLKAAKLSVRQAIEQTKAGIAFKQPKTQKSRRVIDLPTLTVDALRFFKAKQERDRESLGSHFVDHNLVCARPDGRPHDPAELSKAFASLIRATKLPTVRFHDLRHTHATHLLRQGVPAKVVSERLGHSTVGITLDTYSHVLPGMQEEAARKIDIALRSAMNATQQE